MSTLPPEDSRSDNLRERAEWMIARVEGDSPTEAAGLVEELRNARLYAPLLRLAEAIVRKRPDEHRVRRLYAQGLIEQGQVTAAIDVLERLAARLPKGAPGTPRSHWPDPGEPTSRCFLTRVIRTAQALAWRCRQRYGPIEDLLNRIHRVLGTV